jgi:phosphonoacetaldehyde hydrolase
MAEIAAVLFDWAGTMIDFGSRAPVLAMQTVLTAERLPTAEATIRRYMGMAKREHIEAILAEPEPAAQWRASHGSNWNAGDVDRIMEALEPAMRASAAACSTLIPGAAEVFAGLIARGIKVGSTTGYTRTMMAAILPAAREQGYDPAVTICAGETELGRPAPLMLWRAMSELHAWPASSCVAVDDAPVGIAAGTNAGVWTVGVAGSGNGVGLTVEAFAALDPLGRARQMVPAINAFHEVGADFVVTSVADLPRALALIEAAIAAGKRPGTATPVVLTSQAGATA